MKKWFLGLTSVLILGFCVSASAVTINLKVDSNKAEFNPTLGEPFIDSNSRTMIPLRSAAYALGLSDGDVSWNDSLKAVEFTKSGSDGSSTKVTFIIGSKDYDIYTTEPDGTQTDKDAKMDTAAVIKDGRTYAPIRYLAEAFGYSVNWDGETSTITIDTKNKTGKDSTDISSDDAMSMLMDMFGVEDFDTGLSFAYGYESELSFNGDEYYAFTQYEIDGENYNPVDYLFVKSDGTQVWDGTYDKSTGKYTINVYDENGNESNVVSD